ncbi:FadR/GntR family transcriptional regulator [Microbacterium sp. H1-D42]|uniref:FadR/GntR family transcriptional regulator n=1 Tax=Microbacterium sp. H1-D42 TaxID=2925844 RepID=UPI001F5302F3|nr:FadR/GntR family transcriptional regulator [Microbacterium sp. H1-D42]UNK70509.1 FadR family transcriptional regulator [Microbacterium sp. H1-D42]
MASDVVHPPSARREPIERIGATVLRELVELIVSGEVRPGEQLPPEGMLSQQFGVSRTVVREAIKRIQEKGLLSVSQGRGTKVNARTDWNMLDPLVLAISIQRDDDLRVLDELSAVRSALESVMAAATAAAATDEEVAELRAIAGRMHDSIDDPEVFRAADVQFHAAVMRMSGNALAENIAGTLLDRALDSARFHGRDPEHAFELTVAEHDRVLDAIAEHDADTAKSAMKAHIDDSWRRRRPAAGQAE